MMTFFIGCNMASRMLNFPNGWGDIVGQGIIVVIDQKCSRGVEILIVKVCAQRVIKVITNSCIQDTLS